MGKGRQIRSFDYVNRSYDRVRDALKSDAFEIFREATKAAASRAHSVAAGLHVNVGGIEVGTEIAISVDSIEEDSGNMQSERSIRVTLEWMSANAPNLFPLMNAVLSAYPLSGTETQLDFDGAYKVPLGPLGKAMDAVVGHRIAEASVHRFVADVAEYLREHLPA